MANERNSVVSKLQLGQRQNLRGVKKCGSCGEINGNRAQLCRNTACVQHKNALDAVKLVSESLGTSFYSLRTKERDAQPRNYVCIQDVTLSLEQNVAMAIVSSKATCYVDVCKNNNACRHIKACRENSAHMPRAQVYSVSREVLWNLNIGQEQKQQLWQLYKWAEEQEQLPAVQRLNATTFVVKCDRSETFPAGRLHVTALANGLSTKKGTHACACKKLKIILEPDNSLVMQEEICDHLLLVLAGILSSPQGKTIYGNFTNSLQAFWMPAKLETPLGEATQDDLCLGMSINIDVDGVDPQEDILIFGDECFVADQLPDFSDVILNTLTAAPAQSSTNSHAEVSFSSDADVLSSCDIYDEPEVPSLGEDMHLELTDCNIELMDQYQLTDQIDLCSDEIALPIGSEPYNILAAPPIYTKAAPPITNQLPPIELPTIAVVKKTVIKAAEIVDEVKSRKQPQLPAKRALIVNGSMSAPSDTIGTVDVDVEPALAYSAWLDYVVELINESIEPSSALDTPAALSTCLVQQSFHVHKETFSHFCKSFSAGIKRRPLHQVAAIETGKHKGLSKYVWHFGASHTVKRIFSSRNICLQLQRAFERHAAGHFVPYVRQPPVQVPKEPHVYAKLRLYMVNMLFGVTGDNKGGVLLTWTPGILPCSNFGLMEVEFNIQIRAPP